MGTHVSAVNGAGTLLVIGGAEQHHVGQEVILERFVELCRGREADVLVVATASEQPRQRESQYVEVFKRLGVARARPLPIDNREQANADATVSMLEAATGVFFTGGDQLRIATAIGGSRLDSALHAGLDRGLVIAGTSAGAAMMSGTMILSGSEAAVSTESVRTGPGLEFLPGVLIDMHFAERGRLNRLLSAIAMYPHELGIGIDEDTAIQVRGSRFEVLGHGSVTVIDAGSATSIRTPEGGGPIAVTDVLLHVLPAGYTFDLTQRRPDIVATPDNVVDRARLRTETV